MMCVQAGIDVLVEKPFTTTSKDGAELLIAAEARGAIVMTGHTFEYNPALWRLKEVVNDPCFGQIRYIDSARLNLGLYQPDVNVIGDLAPHDISILNYVLDARPSSVSNWGMNLISDQADVAYLHPRCDEIDVDACIGVSWIDPMKVRRTTVVGSNSMAVCDDMATDERVRVYGKGVDRPSAPADDALPPLT
ncbi:MAG: putative dehydrogenase [Candidatus Poriferisodalaceae bacterium]|jgi:predicted dehydrogenase